MLSKDEINIRYKIEQIIDQCLIDDLKIVILENPLILRLNVFGYNQENILHYAAEFGCIEVIAIILKAGVNANVPGIDSETPINRAVKKSDIRRLDFLLSNGAYIDSLPNSISTPLIQAVAFGNLKIVKFFIEKGANINRIHSKLNQTALDISIAFFYDQITDILVKYGAKKSIELLN